MPTSEAAIAGIKANGHKWRYQMPRDYLQPEISKLAEFNNRIDGRDDYDQTIVPCDESEPVVEALRVKVEQWAQRSRTLPHEALEAIQSALEELETIQDCCMEEVNYGLNNLWDEFDYYRILIL